MRRLLVSLVLLLGSLPTPAAAGAQVTYNLVRESNAGMDGGIQWQSVFLLNDGRIMSFGTGNHSPEQSNAVRIIDPVASFPTVTAYDAFPWTQLSSPPSYASGTNVWTSQYDNHPDIYIPSENKFLWGLDSLYDFGTGRWIYGNRSPSVHPAVGYFISKPAGTEDGWVNGIFNPAVGWSTTLDKGVWFGASGGGNGYTNQLIVIERTGSTPPWKATLYGSVTGLSEGAAASYARNSAVVIGSYLYVAGPRADNAALTFLKINVATHTLAATLTPWPAQSGEYFPQMVYDSRRNYLVLIGKRLYQYNLATESPSQAWEDVTPAGWPGYVSPMGVYHPGHDVIYFRGVHTQAALTLPDDFMWHKIKIDGGGTTIQPPPIPTSVQVK
jgi:hypothetical protein